MIRDHQDSLAPLTLTAETQEILAMIRQDLARIQEVEFMVQEVLRGFHLEVEEILVLRSEEIPVLTFLQGTLMLGVTHVTSTGQTPGYLLTQEIPDPTLEQHL